ncbi:methyltransferase domain-containing protein [Thalassotalea montiporae]
MHDAVKEYYGKTLQSSEDLQTNACCTDSNLTTDVKTVLANIHDEVLAKYYGCGLVTPESLTDCHILDLGCGAGRDCYALAQMVGEHGFVTGVDMTEEQLAVANKHLAFHQQKFGYQHANTEFKLGYIEKLDQLGLAENSIDVIVSNCVINLSPDKEAVLKQAYALLKNGGEMYFADVYADRRIPEHLKNDPLLYGECLSGALYQGDFIELAKQVGFADPRLVERREITIDNPEIIERVQGIKFHSNTYRLFKAPELEVNQEDYGLFVVYQGTVTSHPDALQFDQDNYFAKGEKVKVSGNTWQMLAHSRFKSHFEFVGDFSQHLGAFKRSPSCATNQPKAKTSTTTSGCC